MKITITKEAAEALGVWDLVVTAKEVEFLIESNAIEDVFDEDSLMQAIYAWSFLKNKKPSEMTPGLVLKAHKILMLHQELRPDERGYFRKIQVWVGGREGIKWPFIREAMEIWCQNAYLYPENWKEHHVRFEKIHPFVDGNGRLGRILMNWERLKAGEDILVIYADERQEYYKWFDEK